MTLHVLLDQNVRTLNDTGANGKEGRVKVLLVQEVEKSLGWIDD